MGAAREWNMRRWIKRLLRGGLVAALVVGFVVILPLSGKGPMEEAKSNKPAAQVDVPAALPVPEALPEAAAA